MTATIRETNVFTDTFLCLLGKLNAISDPEGKSKWIYHSFPEKTVEKKSDYPLIIITSSDIAYDPLTLTNVKRGPVRFAIDVYSRSADQMDDIASQIVDKMESEEDNFMVSGIFTMRMIGTSYVMYPRGAWRVHNKTINYEFDFGWY